MDILLKAITPVREKFTKISKNLPWIALLVSFFVHLMVMPVQFKIKTVLDLEEREAPQPIRIKLQTSPSSKPKQIVNTEQTGKKIKPKDAKYLGKTDQSFDRQTVAKSNGTFKVAGMGIKTGADNPTPAKQAGLKKELKEAKKVAKKLTNKTPVTMKRTKITFEDLAKAQHHTFKDLANPSRQVASKGLKNGARGKTGLAKNNDFVEDLPLGDMTNMNTIEYKYYGFYHRIRQKLEQYWGRNLREKAKTIYASGRRIPASENKITSLRITLDERGTIVDVHVKSTSGVKELDDAAIEAFNEAGPFPNPPKGMMVNGRAQIEWGFVVKG
jgi:TonB family protein